MDGEKPSGRPILIPPRGITIRASTDFIAATSPIVRHALEYIRANLSKPIGLAQIAAETRMSRATIARLFEQEFGHTAGKEILRQRMELGKRLLKEGSLSIAEIAYRTGFCNPAYFTNTFRRETGLTPKAWRTSSPEHLAHTDALAFATHREAAALKSVGIVKSRAAITFARRR